MQLPGSFLVWPINFTASWVLPLPTLSPPRAHLAARLFVMNALSFLTSRPVHSLFLLLGLLSLHPFAMLMPTVFQVSI